MREWKQPYWQIRSSVLALSVLLLLGVFFRTVNLSERVYWVDEVATSMRVAGYTREQVIDELADGRLLSIADLQHYQQLTPDKGWSDTLAALQRSPEHTPLYFLLARLWSQGFGSSVGAMRSLSVLLSLLALPCLFGLSWELLGSVQVATVAMSLLSVSPFFIAYAQEARPYSLWSLLLLGNGWLLLRAMRCNDRLSWWGYGITAAGGLYTSLLSGLVLLGQGVYVATLARGRFTQTMQRFLLAITGAIVSFIPWTIVILQQWSALQDNTTWMRDPLNPLSRVAIWIYSLVIIFFDVPVSTALSGTTIAKVLAAFTVLSVMGFSLYWLCRQTPQRVWLFVVTLALPVPLILIAIDLMLNGQASATPRYLIPFQLGILLATAALLGQVSFFAPSPPRFRQGVLVFLLTISLLSNMTNLGRIPDYQKARNRENGAIAAILNQAAHPLLLAESEKTIDILSLSHNLNTTVQAQILSSDRFPLTFNQCRPIFLFTPSELLKQKIRQKTNLTLEQIYQPDLLTTDDLHLSLWQLKKLPISCTQNLKSKI